MPTQVSPKASGGCAIALLIIILAVTLINVSSLNPLDVYKSGSTAAKIIVTICAVLVVTSSFQVLAFYMMQKNLELGNPTGVKVQDMMCPGCGKQLLKFAGAYGAPIKCPVCNKAWHDGPVCYNEGMPRKRIIVPIYPCPQCRSRISEQEMFGERDNMF